MENRIQRWILRVICLLAENYILISRFMLSLYASKQVLHNSIVYKAVEPEIFQIILQRDTFWKIIKKSCSIHATHPWRLLQTFPVVIQFYAMQPDKAIYKWAKWFESIAVKVWRCTVRVNPESQPVGSRIRRLGCIYYEVSRKVEVYRQMIGWDHKNIFKIDISSHKLLQLKQIHNELVIYAE